MPEPDLSLKDLNEIALSLADDARTASRRLVLTTGQQRTRAIRRIATALRDGVEAIEAANQKDLAAAEAAGVALPTQKRLVFDAPRIEKTAAGLEQIAEQPDPVGQTIEGHVRPNGLRVERRRVPLGVVLFIYESRPNVTADAAALCLKSGNAVILRGGREAFHTNQAVLDAVRQGLAEADIDRDVVQLVQTTDRAIVPLLVKQRGRIDVVIPRGGRSLIEAVTAESHVPVLKHFDGNCHIFVDKTLTRMRSRVAEIVVNAKAGYPGGAVCNAVEHVLFHADVPAALISETAEALHEAGVQVRGDEAIRQAFSPAKVANDSDWDTEYLDLVVSMKRVDDLEEAIEHINRHGSGHTDAILTDDVTAAEAFVAGVDSASVIVNASTRFADGGEYGLGAEIGISTDKLHARGPMGAADLTSYKWVVTGNGQTRA
ncbi:MAG: glutamate-5-semialdehyde dehydrogenase [Phycisphaerae bacterium]